MGYQGIDTLGQSRFVSDLRHKPQGIFVNANILGCGLRLFDKVRKGLKPLRLQQTLIVKILSGQRFQIRRAVSASFERDGSLHAIAQIHL